jgi:hypothetical protein
LETARDGDSSDKQPLALTHQWMRDTQSPRICAIRVSGLLLKRYGKFRS